MNDERMQQRRISCPPELDPLRRLSPRGQQIVRVARELLERRGWTGLSMRALGSELGIKAPSLYKHFSGKDALRVALSGVALSESGEELHTVIATGGGILELLLAYRRQARQNPHLYRLATAGRLPRSDLPPGLEDWSGEPFFLATEGDPHLAQALWSLAHGMTILELDGRYPTGTAPDETWHAAAALFIAPSTSVPKSGSRIPTKRLDRK